MIQVVLATRNQGKVKELQALLAGYDVEVLGLDRFPQVGEIEETGDTFEENARIKAQAVSSVTGLIALADDSGIVVDALAGAPGVHSARYSGEKATDDTNNAKLLQALDGLPPARRTCRFVSVVVAHAPHSEGGRELVAEGAWEGVVGLAPKGGGGFGYDPLFIDPDLGRTAAELTRDEKNARSHRGKALRKLLANWPAFAENAP